MIDTLGRFSAICYKGDNFCLLSAWFPALQTTFEEGSTLKGKNLLLKASIFFFFFIFEQTLFQKGGKIMACIFF